MSLYSLLTDNQFPDLRMANSLETFRRLAQANLERDQLNRRVLQASAAAAAGSQSALAAAAVSLTTPGLTASDYMRFAMPVRDPDNGDAISGSGEKLLILGAQLVGFYTKILKKLQ